MRLSYLYALCTVNYPHLLCVKQDPDRMPATPNVNAIKTLTSQP